MWVWGCGSPPQKTLIISLSVGLLVAIGAIAVVLAVVLGYGGRTTGLDVSKM